MKNFKLLSTSLILGLIGSYAHAAIPNTLKLDYAYYAPTSLVVKEQKLKLNGYLAKAVIARWNI